MILIPQSLKESIEKELLYYELSHLHYETEEP